MGLNTSRCDIVDIYVHGSQNQFYLMVMLTLLMMTMTMTMMMMMMMMMIASDENGCDDSNDNDDHV